MKYDDLTGQKFDRLTVTAYLGPNRHGHSSYLVSCQCGNQTTVLRHNLLKGMSRSCGCLRAERLKQYWADRKAKEVEHGS